MKLHMSTIHMNPYLATIHINPHHSTILCIPGSSRAEHEEDDLHLGQALQRAVPAETQAQAPGE